MKRWIALSIPVLVVIFFLTAVVVIEAQRTPEWQEVLSRYVGEPDVAQLAARPDLRVVEASLPWNFRADWLFPVLDYGRFAYTLDYYEVTGEKTHTAHTTLPYPPQEVRCVLVRDGAVERVLFVNFYSDNLWQYGWVIQEGERRPFTPEFTQALAEIGCAL